MKKNKRDKEYLEDEVKYRKKSHKVTPKKIDHKHVFEDCVFEFMNPKGKSDPQRGFIPQKEIYGGTYCSICGKIGCEPSFNWYKKNNNGIHHFISYEISERGALEEDPKTRTLPTFQLKDRWFQKYVFLDEKIDPVNKKGE